MPNPGFPQVPQAVARKLRRDTGLPFEPDDVFMTVGSAGACNVILKSILDPGDEVIVLLPCFSEYRFYVSNHAGHLIPVETGENFLPRLGRIAAAITPLTRALLLNSSNNPTGRIYPEAVLRDLNTLLAGAGHEILVISDEPDQHLVFDGNKQAEASSLITNAVVCNSRSMAQALPGERIGDLAMAPRLRDRKTLRAACAFSNRILGFINAPALWQHGQLEAMESTVDVSAHQRKRDLLCAELARAGYRATKPEGTFYVFLKTPIADDIAFVRLLARHGVQGIPGTGFGRAGYLRLSLTVPESMTRGSIPGCAVALRAV